MERSRKIVQREIIKRFNRITGADVKTLHELNVYAEAHPEVLPKLGLGPAPSAPQPIP